MARNDHSSYRYRSVGLYLSFLRQGYVPSPENLDDLAVSLGAPSIYTRLPIWDRHSKRRIESAGFRWCDSTDAGDFLIYEYVVRKIPTASLGRVFLATGSQVKADQYGYLFRSLGLNLRVSNLARWTNEPQVEGVGESDEKVLVEGPLRNLARFAKLRGIYPLVLEDTMLFIEHFNRDFDHTPLLPGPDTKRWWQALGANGVLQQMAGSSRRRATYVSQIGVLDSGGRYSTFRSEVRGSISQEKRIRDVSIENLPYTNPSAFHSIFIPEGQQKTYAEMDPGEFRRSDYRAVCAQRAAPLLIEQASKRPDLQLDFEL